MFSVLFVAAVVYAVAPHPKKAAKGAGGPGGQAGAGGAPGRGGRNGMPTSVSVAPARTASVPILLDALGTVQPTATVTVRPQVAGQITQVRFQEGQMVRQGQLLVQIDPRPYQNAVNQAAAALARDQATLANAKVLLARYQTLLTQDSIARQTVDDQAALVRSQEAVVQSDQAALGTARLSLEYARVTAPVSGRAGLRLVDLGNYVTAGQANGLVVITQVAPIDVAFSLPEDNVRQVNGRARSGATLPVFVYDRASAAQLAAGRLLTLDNQVDTATGTVRAKARFGNGDGALFPNQFVNVKLQVDTLQNATTVPSSAVLRGPNGLYVYLTQPDRTVKIQPVTIGPVSGALTVITSGLRVGQTVVTDGTDRLREGAKIIVAGCGPAAGRRPGAQGSGGQTQGQGAAAGGTARPGGGAGAGAGRPGCPPAGAQPAVAGGPPRPSTQDAATQPRAAAPAAAEAPRAFGGGQGGGMLAQLDLSPTQMQKAQSLMAAARESAGDDPAARGEAMRGAMAEVEKILTPAQKAKFEALRAARRAGGGGFGSGGGETERN